MPTTQTRSQHSAPNRTGTIELDSRPADREDLTAFLDWCQSKGLSKKTLATYREAVEQLAGYTAAKGMPVLANVKREHVEDFLGGLRKRGNKPATVRNRFASLRAFFSWMVRDDLRRDLVVTAAPQLRHLLGQARVELPRAADHRRAQRRPGHGGAQKDEPDRQQADARHRHLP